MSQRLLLCLAGAWVASLAVLGTPVLASFPIGSRVQANASLIIRYTPPGLGDTGLREPVNGLGTVTAGPNAAYLNGTLYNWYNITWDDSKSGWSADVGLNPVKPATPTSPSPGTTGSPGPTESSCTVTLTWNASAGATYYDLGVKDVATGVMVVSTYPASTNYQATLTAGKTYCWNVAAGNGAGESSFTTLLYFQTPGPPGAPTLTSPGTASDTGYTVANQTPTLQWSAVAGADYYALAVSAYPYGSANYVYNPQQVYGTSVAVPAGLLQAGTKYCWNMQAHNANGWSPISNTLYFQTPAAVSPPTLSVSPSVPPTQPATAGSVPLGISNTGGGTMSYSAGITNGSSWLSIASGGSGGNSGTIVVSYTTNTTGVQRSGTVQVTAAGASGSPVTITVTQAASTTTASPFSGKGEWIHKMSSAIASVPGASTTQDLINYAHNSGIAYLIVKAGEGNDPYPYSGMQLNSAFVVACHAAGIKVFGFHYVYGGAYQGRVLSSGQPDPNFDNVNSSIAAEISIAIQILDTGCDGLVIDAESAYEDFAPGAVITPGDGDPTRFYYPGTLPPNPSLPPVAAQTAATAAQAYCSGILSSRPTAVLAHAPFFNPSSQSYFPYLTFGKYCAAVLPQAYYWFNGISPESTVAAMDSQWKTLQNSWINSGHTDSVKPLFPIGYSAPPYASGADITDFVNLLNNDASPATTGGYQGVSFWDADLQTSGIWNAIAAASIGSTPSPDSTPPTISVFSVTPPGSIAVGSSFNASFTVSDAGGSGLKQVVLRRTSGDGSANDPGWQDILTVPVTGNGPVSGSFSPDTPPIAGTYWYGMAVFDNANNSLDERAAGLGPLQRTVVTQDTTPPTVTLTAPNSGTFSVGSQVTLSATANDASGIGCCGYYLVKGGTILGTIYQNNVGGGMVSQYSWTVPATFNGYTINGTDYQIFVEAWDASPNQNANGAVSSAYLTLQPAALTVTAVTSTTWVYQNTPTTTKNRHHIPLTISVGTDTYNSTSYTATVTVTPTPSGAYQGLIVSSTVPNSGGVGALTLTNTCSFLHGNAGLLYLVGGPVLAGGKVLDPLNKSVTKQSGKAGSGQYTVSVTVAGNMGGTVTASPVTITLLMLGDVRANGLITGTNASYVNLYLGSSPKVVPSQVGSGSPDGWADPSLMDITGQGTIIGTDASYINLIVGGSSI